ncbi:hypothetical protein BDV30DRAFT_105183 [Aspergillus minisclerotigenes]|uniref:Prion-inhibition and propagation HeLo domain-containing protein n=1 Tax=Aspergillus minisclerotigenes TaxID=656917 RepID=A0A5N6J676_9EURO|nr:hypothetical protein BDV30DRAFT_105183 [Aspergillus minisclerotigenes]
MRVMDGTNGKLGQGTLETLAIDLSESDIADVFATCVFCLNHAVGRALSATEALELSVIRLRLTRWGEAVNIYDKPVLSGYAPSSNDLCESFSGRAAGASEYINIGAGVQYANLNFWQPGDAPSQRRR